MKRAVLTIIGLIVLVVGIFIVKKRSEEPVSYVDPEKLRECQTC